MSRQHSFISLEVVAWDSRSLLSKMIWIRQNRIQFRKTCLILRFDLRTKNVQQSDLESDEVPRCRDLTSLALAKKSTGFSAFRKAVTVQLWNSVRSPSVYPSAWNRRASTHQMFIFERHQNGSCAISTTLASLMWLSISETIKHQACIPLVSWQGSALLLFWLAHPPPWKHV